VQLTAEHLLRRFKMAASGATPIILYHSTTGSAVPSNTNLAPGELAVNIADMKLYCENDSGVVTLLASAAGSAGDVVGPGSATDGAIVAFDGTTGKLIKAAVLGTGVQTALGVNTGSAGAVVLFDGALGTPSSGTLTNATGLPIATGVSGLGTNVATFLGTPSSANLAAALTDKTGTGLAVFGTSPTFVTPVLGTPTSGALTNCTADGTNPVGFKNIPQSGSAKTTSYILATGDVGKFIEVGASGSIEIPNSTFAAGDVVSIFNNTSGDIAITCTIAEAYIAGVNADETGNDVDLATRGICTILFISGTLCVISGNVS
jgi:hypothetical protein